MSKINVFNTKYTEQEFLKLEMPAQEFIEWYGDSVGQSYPWKGHDGYKFPTRWGYEKYINYSKCNSWQPLYLTTGSLEWAGGDRIAETLAAKFEYFVNTETNIVHFRLAEVNRPEEKNIVSGSKTFMGC